MRKGCVDTEFVNFVNEYDQVVTKNLAQDFVGHCCIRLRPHAVTELPLDHAEGRLDVRALVIVSQVIIVPPQEVMEHFPPHFAVSAIRTVPLESDKRHGVQATDRFDVLGAQISLVTGYLRNPKVLCGGLTATKKYTKLYLSRSASLGKQRFRS